MARKPGSKLKAAEREIRDVAFLPDLLDQVKAIAMQGLTDDEMAQMFGIPPNLIKRWKQMYPSFKKAIDEGRTMADAKVVEALYKKAVGFERTYDKVVFTREGAETITVTEELPPDTHAIKFWLTNRQRDQWKDRREHAVGGSKDLPPVGVKQESKVELMSSILGLIKSKPD